MRTEQTIKDMIKDLEQFLTDEMLHENPRAYNEAYDLSLALEWVVQDPKWTPLSIIECRMYGFAGGVNRHLTHKNAQDKSDELRARSNV